MGSGLKEAALLVVAVVSSAHDTASEALVVKEALLEMFNRRARFCSWARVVEVLGLE